MAEFAYNNTKNTSISYTSFELNCGYHPRIFVEKDTNLHSRSKFADKLLAELQNLMTVYQENLYQPQKFQRWAYDKGVMHRSYVPMTKFDLIVNTSESNKIKSLKINSLDHSERYTL